MHVDRGIVCTYRHSDGLCTRPDNQNTLTCQSVDTNDAHRDPLHGSIIWNLSQTHLYYMLRLRLCLRLRLQSRHLRRCHHQHDHFTSAPRACPLLHQVPDASFIIGIRSSVLAAVSNWTLLTCFSILLDSIVVSIY